MTDDFTVTVMTLRIGTHRPLSFSHNAQGLEEARSNGAGFALRHGWSATSSTLTVAALPVLSPASSTFLKTMPVTLSDRH